MVVYECYKTSSKLTDDISKDLKKSHEVCWYNNYLFLSSEIGLINSYEKVCFMHRKKAS